APPTPSTPARPIERPIEQKPREAPGGMPYRGTEPIRTGQTEPIRPGAFRSEPARPAQNAPRPDGAQFSQRPEATPFTPPPAGHGGARPPPASQPPPPPPRPPPHALQPPQPPTVTPPSRNLP